MTQTLKILIYYDINNTWNETRDYYYNNIMKVISPFEKIHNLVSIKLCNIIYICVCVCVCVCAVKVWVII